MTESPPKVFLYALAKKKHRLSWWNEKSIEVTACAGHVHILVDIFPKLSVSSFMSSLKEKTLWEGMVFR